MRNRLHRWSSVLAAPLLAVLLACAGAKAERSPLTPAVLQPAAIPERRAFLWEITRSDIPDRPLYLTGSVHVGQPG